MTRARRKPSRPTVRPKTIPSDPHSDLLQEVRDLIRGDAEKMVIGCLLWGGRMNTQAEVDALLEQLTPGLFEQEQCLDAFQAMRKLREHRHAVDLVTVAEQLRADGKLRPDSLVWLSEAQDECPSPVVFPLYLEALQKAALRRWSLAKSAALATLAASETITLDRLREEFSELNDKAEKIGRQRPKPLQTVKLSEHLKYMPNETLALVGDGDITKGYQGITVIAGPPGSGKSLVGTSLAIAGALGESTFWQGRPVHRQFRTLIVQCENGASRLKKECQAMSEAYPKTDFDAWIRFTLPPEGGLPFHRPEFRRALAREVEEFKPDVLLLDPWTAVAAEDAAKDIIEKLAEIRSVLPPGDACPALVIVAHTKKPRAEDKGNRGRALMYSVSGSQALVATARCVYVLLPFTDDIQDDRVLWACAKLSDSEHAPADTVWHRRLGRTFVHCPDNPEEFWSEDGREDRMWLTAEMVKTELKASAMTASRLAQRLADAHNQGKGRSSVHNWLKRPEFSSLLKSDGGLLSWAGS